MLSIKMMGLLDKGGRISAKMKYQCSIEMPDCFVLSLQQHSTEK